MFSITGNKDVVFIINNLTNGSSVTYHSNRTNEKATFTVNSDNNNSVITIENKPKEKAKVNKPAGKGGGAEEFGGKNTNCRSLASGCLRDTRLKNKKRNIGSCERMWKTMRNGV